MLVQLICTSASLCEGSRFSVQEAGPVPVLLGAYFATNPLFWGLFSFLSSHPVFVLQRGISDRDVQRQRYNVSTTVKRSLYSL